MIAPTIPQLRDAGITLSGACVASLVYRAVALPQSAPNRAVAAYAAYLDRRFKSMFMPANVRAVLVTQALTAYAIVATAVAVREPRIVVFVLLVALLPWLFLEMKHRRRVRAIEDQTDGFLLSLANALKATPSVADAFLSLVHVVAEPMKGELDLATKEMRLGCTLEEALMAMAGRVSSRVLDTGLACVLVGQRVGGNLPKILETSAAALRELSRLERMVRSKTASGRIQMWVISVAPLAFVIFFDRTQPGYFDVLGRSTIGIAIIAGAIVLWLVAVILGRRILRIDV